MARLKTTVSEKDSNEEETSVPVSKAKQKVAAKSMKMGRVPKGSTGVRVGGNGPRRPAVSMAKKAGLSFPVIRFLKMMKKANLTNVITRGSAVYLTGVLEYLVAEVLELAGNAAKALKKRRVINRHIYLAIHQDEELHKICKDVTICEAGVVPFVHPNLVKTTPVKKTHGLFVGQGQSQEV